MVAEKLKLQTSESKFETGICSVETASEFCTSITSAMFTGSNSLCRDGEGQCRSQSRPTSINSDSSDESDDVVSLDSPLHSPAEQEQQLSLSSNDTDVTLQVAVSQGSRATISFTPSPHRLRSNHICHKSHPYN